MSRGATQFYRSQTGGASVINYSYTDFPWRLFLKDLYYFFVYAWSLPWLLWPWYVPGPGGLNELSLTWGNFYCVALHVLLVILQGLFILALPFTIFFPVWIVVSGVSAFLVLNWGLSRLLNGSEDTYYSDERYASAKAEHAHEQWVFVNGVAVGEHWLKSNLNRLAVTFKRPILGIHNRTDGIIFDLIECMIQRNFSYATSDVRIVYRVLKDVLYDPGKSKVILMLHSQGGIQGSLVLDWLLQELPQDLLCKVEVYTFGNAANHFNSPHRHVVSQQLLRKHPLAAASLTITETSMATSTASTAKEGVIIPKSETAVQATSRTSRAAQDRAILHIEHYAHVNDFVALWGVLHFATNKTGSPKIPRFIGRLFARSSGSGGHLMNQHYLDGLFPLAHSSTGEPIGADENNSFVDEPVSLGREHASMERVREAFEITYASTVGVSTTNRASSVEVHGVEALKTSTEGIRVRDVSRLWSYRNGQSPKEQPPLLFTEGGMPRNATM